MSPNEYQKLALRTESYTDLYETFQKLSLANNLNPNMSMVRLLNGVMGLSGESGEADDLVKKHLFQGHELDLDHLVKELGDVAWYLAIAADAIGYDLETIFRVNIEKLKERYPDGFEANRSVNRKPGDI